MRRSVAVVGSVLFLALGAVVLAQAPKAETKPAASAAKPAAADRHDAQKKARDRSASAVRRGDFQAALEAANEAVELDPTDAESHVARAILLQQLHGAGTSEEMNRRMEQLLREDYRTAAEGDPDSTVAAVARDALAQVEGRQLFPDQDSGCSKEASAELDTAEHLFLTNHLKDSLAHYEKAAQGCPEDPVVWTHYGDAYFALDDLTQAQSRFEKALAKSPWHAQGHRFLADTLVRQGKFEAAYHESVLAVLSDPSYEAGWGGLRAYVAARGGTWNRAYGAKPEIKVKPLGKVDVNIDAKGPDPAEWTFYAMAKASFLVPAKKHAPPPPKTALGRERGALQSVLQIRKELKASGKPPAPSRFWDMMTRADQAGFLDEAIFLHLLDRDLLPEYLAFRDKNRDRLVRYTETVLAPLPPPRSAPAMPATPPAPPTPPGS